MYDCDDILLEGVCCRPPAVPVKESNRLNMLSIDVTRIELGDSVLLAPLLALLEVTGITATAAEERTNDGILVCLVKDIVVGLDGPWRRVELGPVDLRLVSDAKRVRATSERLTYSDPCPRMNFAAYAAIPRQASVKILSGHTVESGIRLVPRLTATKNMHMPRM
jgi:hypothetical protein